MGESAVDEPAADQQEGAESQVQQHLEYICSHMPPDSLEHLMPAGMDRADFFEWYTTTGQTELDEQVDTLCEGLKARDDLKLEVATTDSNDQGLYVILSDNHDGLSFKFLPTDRLMNVYSRRIFHERKFGANIFENPIDRVVETWEFVDSGIRNGTMAFKSMVTFFDPKTYVTKNGLNLNCPVNGDAENSIRELKQLIVGHISSSKSPVFQGVVETIMNLRDNYERDRYQEKLTRLVGNKY